MRNDIRILRRRLDDAFAALPRPRRSSTGAPTMLGVVTDRGDMPTTVPAFFSVTPATVQYSGPPMAGMPITVEPYTDGRSSSFLVIGPDVPVAGDALIARLAPGGRWIADHSARPKTSPCCTCIPRTLLFDSDAPAVMTGDDALPPFYTGLPYPLTFEWGPPPVPSVVIYSAGGGSGAQGVEGLDAQAGAYAYVQFPSAAWFTEPFSIAGGAQIALYAYVSGCAMFIIPFSVGAVTVNLLAGGTTTFGGFYDPFDYLCTGLNKAWSPCNPFEVDFWTFGGIAPNEVSGTDYLIMTGSTSYYYQYGGCIELDNNFSAGVGQVLPIPGAGYYGGGDPFGGTWTGGGNQI